MTHDTAHLATNHELAGEETSDPGPASVIHDSSAHKNVSKANEKPTVPLSSGVPRTLPLSQRRREPRYAAVADRLWLQWWEGDEYLGRSARLVNVSRHGAMIVSSHMFQSGQAIRIFLEDPAPQVPVDSVVLGVVEGLTGLHQVRLNFLRACPDEFIEAAASGFESWLAGKRPRI